jgi:hypothetical protein
MSCTMKVYANASEFVEQTEIMLPKCNKHNIKTRCLLQARYEYKYE